MACFLIPRGYAHSGVLPGHVTDGVERQVQCQSATRHWERYDTRESLRPNATKCGWMRSFTIGSLTVWTIGDRIFLPDACANLQPDFEAVRDSPRNRCGRKRRSSAPGIRRSRKLATSGMAAGRNP